MRKYVFLTSTITGIGGSIIYTRNKKAFLEDSCWEVEVFSGMKGEVMVKELASFRNCIFSDLNYPPYLFTEAKRERILEKLSNAIDHDGAVSIVIESNTITMALWGELLAPKIGAKHFVFLLNETFYVANERIFDFFDYKHKRKELAGINKESLSLLFKGYKELSKEEKYHLCACCTNAVDPNYLDKQIDEIPRKDLNIGCITRLEKGFVKEIIEEIVVFANQNQGLEIQLIFFGGSNNKSLAKFVEDKSKILRNLEVLVTGFLFPIPGNVFKKADIFIGTAGSARIPADMGKLTISVDTRNGRPIGIFGRNTLETTYDHSEENYALSELLQIILNNNWHIGYSFMANRLPVLDFPEEFSKHMDLLANSENGNDYFDLSFPGMKLTKKDTLKGLLLSLLSSDVLQDFSRIKQKIKALMFCCD